MNLLLLLAAGDLVLTAVQARRQARAKAGQGVRDAERYLAWALKYGTREQLAEAQQTADAWLVYRDSL